MEGLQGIADAAGVGAVVSGEPPAFDLWFGAAELVNFRDMMKVDGRKQGRFAELLMDRGVIKAHEKFFVSMAHSDEDIDATIAAARSAMEALATECGT